MPLPAGWSSTRCWRCGCPQRFGLSAAQAGAFFFWAGLLTTALAVARPQGGRAHRLLNTMVFTHIPANLCLIGAAFAPISAAGTGAAVLAQLCAVADGCAHPVGLRDGVVTPAERTAAASFTAVPRSLAAALSPSLGGALFAAGLLAAPLVACGCLKIAYDLALWQSFRRHPVDGLVTKLDSR
jgi:hypothetical protein